MVFGPAPRALGRGQEVKYHLISVAKSISKMFYTNLCVCSYKQKILNISNKILFCPLSIASELGLWGVGVLGSPEGQSFSKQGHVTYQIKRDDE